MSEIKSVRLTDTQRGCIAMHFAREYIEALDSVEFHRSRGYGHHTSEQRTMAFYEAELLADERLAILRSMIKRGEGVDVHWFAIMAAEHGREQHNRKRAECARRFGVAA